MSEQSGATGFTLWHRASKYVRWKIVAEAQTEAELTGRLKDLPSGESVCLPKGEHPNDRRATRGVCR